MDHIVFECFIFYALDNNNLKMINNLRNVCNEYKMIIDNNIYYKRKKSAYLLSYTFYKLEMNIGEDKSVLNNDFIENKHDFKYILNSIYNYSVGDDFTYTNYKKNLNDYKYDKFNPLKRMRQWTYCLYKQKMNISINLNMALMHAEKPYSIAKAREIDDYF